MDFQMQDLKTQLNMLEIEKSILNILINIGENPNREGLIETPKRVAKSFAELFSGYHQCPSEILSKTFNEATSDGEFISLVDIEFVSMCEHHMLPFSGKAHVAYIPNGKVVGLSKLARLVECHARRLQIQERMTDSIAGDIEQNLEALGVMVVIESHHSCMSCRGVKKSGSTMITKSTKGEFKNNYNIRQEFLSLIR